MSSLRVLSLSENGLTGSLPTQIKNTLLEQIILNDNRLSGSIPSAFGGLAQVNHLEIGGNSLSGWIPSELGQCQKLRKFRRVLVVLLHLMLAAL